MKKGLKILGMAFIAVLMSVVINSCGEHSPQESVDTKASISHSQQDSTAGAGSHKEIKEMPKTVETNAHSQRYDGATPF
jgi:hypothetical protein